MKQTLSPVPTELQMIPTELLPVMGITTVKVSSGFCLYESIAVYVWVLMHAHLLTSTQRMPGEAGSRDRTHTEGAAPQTPIARMQSMISAETVRSALQFISTLEDVFVFLLSMTLISVGPNLERLLMNYRWREGQGKRGGKPTFLIISWAANAVCASWRFPPPHCNCFSTYVDGYVC